MVILNKYDDYIIKFFFFFDYCKDNVPQLYGFVSFSYFLSLSINFLIICSGQTFSHFIRSREIVDLIHSVEMELFGDLAEFTVELLVDVFHVLYHVVLICQLFCQPIG